MRETLIIISFFLLNSCQFDFKIDRKISVDEFINEELKSFNWNEVDQYPVFENCLGVNNISEKNNCLVDTVNMILKVDKTAEISIESINISSQNIKYKEVISRSFNNTISNLPKLYPAIKRGQQVDVIFKIPIIISTE